MSFNGKGFTIEGLLRSLFTELLPGFPSSSIKNFSKISGSTFNFLFLAFEFIIVYFIYLRSKAAIGLTELFSIFFSILLKIL